MNGEIMHSESPRTTEPEPNEPQATATTPPAESAGPRRNSGRRRLIESLLFELALPVGGYYVMVGFGLSQWLALTVSGLATLPWLVYGLVKRGRIEAMPVFTLVLLVVGALMSLVTGSPRALLVRDSWLFGVIGVWVLGSLATQRPFMLGAGRSVVSSKLGEEAATAWADRWHTEPVFRHHLRLLTAVWGAGFLLDAAIRVVFACTLPVGTVPLVNSLQWLAVLGALFGFHFWYVSRHGLRV